MAYELRSLEGLDLRPGAPNFLMGVAGNGLSTSLQQEIYSRKPQRVYYLNYFNLPKAEEYQVLLEFINAIFNAISLAPLRYEDISSFHTPFEIFNLGVDLVRQANPEKVQLTIVFDEFQRLQEFSNAFFFTLDKLLSIGQILPEVELTSILISDEFINPRTIRSTEGLGKLFIHHPHFEFIPVPNLLEIQGSGMQKHIAQYSLEQQREIYQLSGGIPSLFVSVADVYAEFRQDLERYLTDYQVEWKIHEIWESLGREGRDLLLALKQGSQVAVSDELQRQFLERSNILDSDLNYRAKLLEEYANKQFRLSSMEDPGNILVGDIVLKAQDFTPQQELVLRELAAKPGRVVAREKVAELIWGEEVSERYSDYAIDKLMSKLRKMLAAQKNLDLATKKGRGYVLLIK